MSTPITGKIVALLQERGIAFQLLHHAPVTTSQEAAAVRGTPLHEGAKAIVFSADGRLLLAVLPADRRVDTRAFKRQHGIKDLHMVSAEELRAQFELEVGAVPPFGSVLGLPTYVDRGLLANQRISFNAGSRTTSIIMACQDYIAVEQPTVAEFAENKSG
jgi:Ala-tRNA(Pro) deacylase